MKIKNVFGVWFLAVVAAVLCTGCSRQLTGTVFIVTEGAQTFRLPLTTVEVVKADEFRKYCKAVEPELAKHQESKWAVWSEIIRKSDENKLRSETSRELIELKMFLNKRTGQEMDEFLEVFEVDVWAFFIGEKSNEKLPPSGTGQTDADGKFNIKVPGPGAYFVKARAKRSIGNKNEHYRWIVPITISTTGDATIDLSNQNLSNESSLAGLLDTELLKAKKPKSPSP